jgi:AraC-like DNA-binding protein
MGDIHNHLREIHRIGGTSSEFLIHPEHCPALNRYAIGLAGVSLAGPAFRFVRHHPIRGQILVCFRGRGRVFVDNQWRRCEAGQAYVSPPARLHAYESLGQWEVGWIGYAHGQIGKGAPNIAKPVLIEIDPRPLEHALWGLHQEISTRREPAMLDHWGEILGTLGVRILEPYRSSRLWRLWLIVQADLGKPWTLPALAQLSGYSAEHLRRLCMSEIGCSPMQHVTRLRMQQAISLISAGHTIAAAAHAVGYENTFAFSTAFKRQLGVAPSSFLHASRKKELPE